MVGRGAGAVGAAMPGRHPIPTPPPGQAPVSRTPPPGPGPAADASPSRWRGATPAAAASEPLRLRALGSLGGPWGPSLCAPSPVAVPTGAGPQPLTALRLRALGGRVSLCAPSPGAWVQPSGACEPSWVGPGAPWVLQH